MKLVFTAAFLLAVLAIGVGGFFFLQSKEGALFVMEQRGVALTSDSVIEAVKANDLDALGLMARAQLSFDEARSDGVTPLIEAVRSKNHKVTKVVLDRVQKVDARDSRGMTALGHAMILEDWETAKRLAARGASVEKGLSAERSVIVDATAVQNVDLLEFLIDHGAEVDVSDGQGMSPLIHAIVLRENELLGRLLKAGADPNTVDCRGNTAFLLAVRLGDVEASRLLLSHGGSPRLGRGAAPTPLAVAVGRDDVAMVEFLLGEGIVPLPEDERYVPLVVAAVQRENFHLVNQLIGAGALLEGVGPGGERALEVALGKGDEDLFFALLEGGAKHEDLFDDILESGSDRLVKRFLSIGVDVEVKSEEGETFLARTVREGDFKMARNLIAVKADATVTCRDGQTVLAWAVAQRQPELVKALIEAGADPNTPLASPISNEFREKFSKKTLLYYLGNDGELTLLMVAAGSAQKEIVGLLLEHGAETNVYTRKSKVYPVNFAAHIGNTDLMQMILGRKAGDETRKIVLDLSEQRALVYVDGEVVVSTAVSSGKNGYRTATGEFVITNKHRHWTSTIYGASMTYFMRLNCDSFGFHEGYTPSYPASHGCIRLPSGAAKKLFGMMEVGDLVTIKK